jgi:hypothetical protein
MNFSHSTLPRRTIQTRAECRCLLAGGFREAGLSTLISSCSDPVP